VAETFAKHAKSLMIVCDESDEVKNPKALRTKALMELKRYSRWRRNLTGTPIDGTPFSAFAQYNFLDETILGTRSYTAFKAEYAEMLDKGHPLMAQIVKRNPRAIYAQIVATDGHGLPKYKNLDALRRLIAPYTFRVLKSECLDLPKKVYKTAYFALTPEQHIIYKKAEEELRLAFDGNDTPFNRLAMATKLAQITSGYFLHPMSTDPVRIPGEAPKMALLVERVRAVVATGGKVIVWARYQVEIDDILAALREPVKGEPRLRCVRYDGQVGKEDRVEHIEAFERGSADVFVGNQQAGGTGITLVAASVVIYFSNNFSLRDRLQSEDRAHRIGQTKTVTYYNLVAKDTIDEAVVKALMNKKDVADMIVDGTFSKWSSL
jgi:SNF2 family DNA or RNA helicase